MPCVGLAEGQKVTNGQRQIVRDELHCAGLAMQMRPLGRTLRCVMETDIPRPG